jgi:hypothetical protein
MNTICCKNCGLQMDEPCAQCPNCGHLLTRPSVIEPASASASFASRLGPLSRHAGLRYLATFLGASALGIAVATLVESDSKVFVVFLAPFIGVLLLAVCEAIHRVLRHVEEREKLRVWSAWALLVGGYLWGTSHGQIFQDIFSRQRKSPDAAIGLGFGLIVWGAKLLKVTNNRRTGSPLNGQ